MLYEDADINYFAYAEERPFEWSGSWLDKLDRRGNRPGRSPNSKI